MPDIVALGFAFDANNAQNDITNIVKSLTDLDEKSQSVKGAFAELQKIFSPGGLPSGIRQTTKSLGKLNAALIQTADFAKKTVDKLTPLVQKIGQIKTDHIKPIPDSVVQSFTNFSNAAKNAAAAVEQLTESAKSIPKSPVVELNNAMQQTGEHAESLSEYVSKIFRKGAIAAYFKKSTEMAIRFGEELAYINSLTLEFDIGRIRTGLLNLGGVLGSVTQNANGLYTAYSSGVRGTEEDLVKFTAKMAELATVIRADITPTIYAATSAINAYGMSARDAGELTDLFYAIVKQGRANGQQLAAGLGQVISTAATAGLSLDEMGASIASLTKVMQTRNAITYFNNMLSKMIKPTKETRLAAEKLGIELGIDALRAKGFAGVMQEIRDKTKGSQQALLSLFPDLRGQRAALQLLNKGWDDFQNQLQYFANKSGVASEAMKELTHDMYFQIGKIPNTLNKIKIATGDLLVKIFTLGGALTPLISAFNRMGESGQKVVGAITLMIGGYVLFRTWKKIIISLGKAESVINVILSAQRKKEVAEHGAITKSLVAEAAARKLNAAAAMQSAQANATSGIIDIAKRGGGFGAGFSAMFDTKAFKDGLVALGNEMKMFFPKMIASFKGLFGTLKSFSASGAISAISNGFIALKGIMITAATGFGAVVGKVAAWVTAFVTITKVIVSGIVAIVVLAADIAQSLMRVGDWLEGTFILGPLTRWIAGVGSAQDRLKALDKILPKVLDTRRSINALKNFANDIMDEFQRQFEERTEMPTKNVVEQVKKTSEFLQKALWERANKYNSQNLIDAQREAEDSGKAYEKYLKEIQRRISNGEEITDENNQKLEELKKRWEEAKRKTEEIKNGATANAEAILSYVQKIQNLATTQREALQSISAMGDDFRYSMMTPVQKMAKQAENLKKYQDEYYKAIAEGNAQVAEQAFKNMLAAHDALVRDAEEKMKKYGRLKETSGKDSFDFLLKATDQWQKRSELLRQRAEELYQESGVRWINDFNGRVIPRIPTDANIDLADAYNKAKEAANMQISALQEEIRAKEKLAQAERRFNDNTLQLIRTMDKFNATTVAAVNANSRESQQLQSRVFVKIPQVQIGTNAQNDLGQSRKDLDELYERLREMTEAFRRQAAEREASAKQQKDAANEQVKNTVDNSEATIKKLDENVEKVLDAIREVAKAFKEGKTEAELADPIKKIEKAVSNIGVVTY